MDCWEYCTVHNIIVQAFVENQRRGILTLINVSVSDGGVKVPNGVLQKVNSDLQSLRMSMFKLLQPKLHCQLGKLIHLNCKAGLLSSLEK